MKIELTQERLQDLLAQSAYIGAQRAMDDAVVYHLKDAAERLNMSYPTLRKRIAEGKIKTVDGRITGGEIRRYLQLI